MTTIYLVWGWDGNDTGSWVYAAFSSRESAEAYCAQHNATEPEFDYEVREMELQA